MAVASLLVVVGTIHLGKPLFWYIDDKRNQYIPVFRDIGRRLLETGQLPTIDPNLGPSGNYSIDVQYGLYDPTHLLVDVLIAPIDNLALASALLAWIYLVVLVWGSVCAAQRLGIAGVWSAVTGLAAGTGGWVWFVAAPNWIPGLISLAWLPWLWWALLGRPSWRRCAAVAVFTFLVLAGGWPATWLILVVLLGAYALEARMRRTPEWGRPLVASALSCAAGGLLWLISVWPVVQAAAATNRNFTLASTGRMVPQPTEFLWFASPTLRPAMESVGGGHWSMPIFFTAWFALPLLWCVRWERRLLQVPGFLTVTVATAGSLVLTQLPTDIGPLRNPARQMSGVQLFMVVGVVLAVLCCGIVVTRRRLIGLGGCFVVLAYVTWARDPMDPRGLSMLAVVAASALLVWVLVTRRRWTGLLTLATTVVLVVMASYAYRLPDYVREGTGGLTAAPVTVSPRDWPVMTIQPRGINGIGQDLFRQGAGPGFMRLGPRYRVMPGYSSVSSAGLLENVPFGIPHGLATRNTLFDLFRREARTDKRWVDLLGVRTILAERDLWDRFWLRRPSLADQWQVVHSSVDLLKLKRERQLSTVGRVTEVMGAARVAADTIGPAGQRYDVTTRHGATLVFRDLWWPGYQAALGGHELDVRPLSGTLVSVQLPPGADGLLTLRWDPLPTWFVVSSTSGALVLLVAAGVLVRRRRQPSSD